MVLWDSTIIVATYHKLSLKYDCIFNKKPTLGQGSSLIANFRKIPATVKVKER